MRYGMLTFEEPKPDTSRKILHVDMDAFYASIEARDNPKIANKPIVIAKHPKLTNGRGIVSTCNYKARQYGIRSAMSAMEAYKRCPHAVFIQGNMQHYAQVSQQIHRIFRRYTDKIEPLSLDEAYLDVTANKLGIKSATYLAKMIQTDIQRELQLTCSVGVSYNKFIAKIASDYKKPSGITVVTPQQAPLFLKELPIEKFYGVGKKSVPHFHEKGIYTGADLIQWEFDDLMQTFGKMGQSLYFKVRGIHHSPVESRRERKSLGRETTFSRFLEAEEAVLQHIALLSAKVMKKVREKQLKAQTVTLKIRYENFETITRQITVADYFDDEARCVELATQLWEQHGDLTHSVRLLGVSVSQFEDKIFSPIALEL
ncbi:MAG: DNA polymerase IV [Aerococcaceae bacterium]|nr:DNA polymerase IV [Aerococcaceae bacterium]